MYDKEDMRMLLQSIGAATSDQERQNIAYSYAPLLDSERLKALRNEGKCSPDVIDLLQKMLAAYILNKIVSADSPHEMMQVAESYAENYDEYFLDALKVLRHEAHMLREEPKVRLLDILTPKLQGLFNERRALEKSRLCYNQGVEADQSGRHEEAITHFTKAIEAYPDHPHPWMGRGASFAVMGKYEKALSDSEQAIRLNPNSQESWNNKAACLMAIGRTEEAAKAYERCVELAPNVAKPWIGLGKCYLDLGRYQGAVEAFRKAIDLDSRSFSAWHFCGIAYLELNQPRDARYCFLSALEIEPDSPYALDGLRESERRLERDKDEVYPVSIGTRLCSSDLLEEKLISKTLCELRKRFGVKAEDGDNGVICSVFVMGSFTNREERSSYSDIDVAILFREGYVSSNMDSIMHRLAEIESDVSRFDPSRKIKLWPKPVEWYRDSPPFEVSSNDFLFLIWQLLRARSSKCAPDTARSASTPESLLELDGWSGLATQVLRDYEIATGVTILGEELIENVDPVDPLPSQEWDELYLVATRDLALGCAARAQGFAAIREGKLERGRASLRQGDNSIAKSVLRVAYAYEIKDEQHPLNSYAEIWHYAQSRLGLDDQELVARAYEIKVTGTDRYSGSIDLLGWRTPTVGPIHKLTRFFRVRRADLLKGLVYDPQISPMQELEDDMMYWHVRVEDNLPTRRFYFERTIPKIIEDLGEQDVDPEIALIFVPEIVNFLKGEMISIRDQMSDEKIWTHPRIRNAIEVLERIIWHFFKGLEDGPESPYMRLCAQYLTDLPGDRIHEEVAVLLYSDEPLPLVPTLPAGFLDDLNSTFLCLADYYREVGLHPLQVLHNTYITHAEVTLRKFMFWLKKVAPKEVDLRYGIILRLAYILGKNNDWQSEDSLQQWKEEVSLYEEAMKLMPERYEAYYNLAYRYFWLGDREKSRDLAVRAIELNENCMQAWGLYFDYYEMKAPNSDMDIVRASCEDALKRNPRHPMALACLFRYFLEKGDEEQALVFWKRLREADPKLDSFSNFQFLPSNVVMWLTDNIH